MGQCIFQGKDNVTPSKEPSLISPPLTYGSQGRATRASSPGREIQTSWPVRPGLCLPAIEAPCGFKRGLPGPQFPRLCRSRLSRRTRPALTQRDSLWQERGAARIAAQASGWGWGTSTRLGALSSRLGAAGEDRGARRWAGKWGRDPRLRLARARSAPPPQPAALRQPGPELRPPPPAGLAASSRLPRSLVGSLPRGRLGADSAARCSRGWKMAGNDCGALLDEELSSFFLNYLADTQVRPAGAAGPGPEVLSCGGCRRSRGGREAAVGALGGPGVPGCRTPIPCAPRCAPLRGQGAGGPPAHARTLAPRQLGRV